MQRVQQLCCGLQQTDDVLRPDYLAYTYSLYPSFVYSDLHFSTHFDHPSSPPSFSSAHLLPLYPFCFTRGAGSLCEEVPRSVCSSCAADCDTCQQADGILRPDCLAQRQLQRAFSQCRAWCIGQGCQAAFLF